MPLRTQLLARRSRLLRLGAERATFAAMSGTTGDQSGVHGDSSKKERKCYVSDLDGKTAPAFAIALRNLFPLHTPRAQLSAFFQERTSADTVRHWRSGRRNPPPWAREMVRQYLEAQLQLVDATRVSVMGARGPENLRKMRAARLERRA